MQKDLQNLHYYKLGNVYVFLYNELLLDIKEYERRKNNKELKNINETFKSR